MKKPLIRVSIIALIVTLTSVYLFRRPSFFYGVLLASPFLVIFKVLFTPKKNWSLVNLCIIAFLAILLFPNVLGIPFEALTFSNFLACERKFFFTLIKVVLGIGLPLLASLGLGKKVLGVFKFRFSKAWEDYLFSLGMGISILIFLAFGLAFFHSLSFWPVVTLLGVSLLTLRGSWFVSFLKRLSLLKLETEDFLFSPKNGLFFLFFLLPTFSFLAKFRAFPVSCDGLISYFSTVRIISENHRLLTRSYAIFPPTYNLELFLSLVAQISGMTGAISFLPVLGLFCILSFYLFLKSYFGRNTALLGSLVFFTMPTILAFFVDEDKIDLGALFFSLLSFWAFFKWLEDKGGKWVALSGYFAGVAFGVKITAVFLVSALLGTLGFQILKKRSGLPTLLKLAFIFLIFFLLPNIPWMVELKPHLDLGGQAHLGQLPFKPIFFLSHPSPQIAKTCYGAEIQQHFKTYVTGFSLLDRLFQPVEWFLALTLRSRLAAINNPGNVYLTVLVLLPFFLLTKAVRLPRQKFIAPLVVFTTLYFPIWNIASITFLWYALPGFLGLATLVTLFILSLKDNFLRRILVALVIFSGIVHFSFQALLGVTLAASPQEGPGTYFKRAGNEPLLGIYQISKRINQLKGEIKVFEATVNRFFPYFIDTNDLKFIPNDNFIFNVENFQTEEMHQRLKNFGITHLLVETNPREFATECRREEFEDTQLFIKGYTRPVYQNRFYSLYKLI
jgi:hypothetical protein